MAVRVVVPSRVVVAVRVVVYQEFQVSLGVPVQRDQLVTPVPQGTEALKDPRAIQEAPAQAPMETGNNAFLTIWTKERTMA